jgi:hypothetical protein
VVFCASSGEEELTIKFAGLEVVFVIAASTDSEDNPPVVFCASSGEEELTIKFAGLEVVFVIAASTDSEDNPPVVFVMLVLLD